MHHVLITGATGFIGSSLVRELSGRGYRVRGTVSRRQPDRKVTAIEWQPIGDIDATTDWREALRGIDTVVHAAGVAHLLRRQAKDRSRYYRVNFDATVHLARSAARAGVKRLVFLSTVGVLGTATRERPFTENTASDPCNDYAKSKWLAEQGLKEVAAASGLEFVILRPPLVYGERAPGNFQRLVRLVATRVPLPFGSIRNQRSMISVSNLTDLLADCIVSASAKNETYLVADGVDVSTPELLEWIAEGLGVRLHLINIPAALLLKLGGVLGRAGEIESLCGSLQLDTRKIRQHLDWTPRFAPSEAIVDAVRSYGNDR